MQKPDHRQLRLLRPRGGRLRHRGSHDEIG
jgi:hypothetical protein